MRELNDIELKQVSGGTGYRLTSLDFFGDLRIAPGDLRFVPDGLRHEPSIVVVPTPSSSPFTRPVSPRPDIDFLL